MAHLICVDHTRLELAEILVELRKASVENLMALAGDPPRNGQVEGELKYAIELVQLAQAIGGFSVGVAAHTAGHPNSPDLKTDRYFLKEKLNYADFAITQMFFDVTSYYRLIDEMDAVGNLKPIIPGIMPIGSYRSIKSMINMGADFPEKIVLTIEDALKGVDDPIRKDEITQKIGIEMTVEMCSDLIKNDAPGLHFYTLNKSNLTREIYSSLGLNQK